MDRVNVVVDFDGDGRTGYNFMVTLAGGIADEIVTNESNFRDDWDGNWRHAVTEDDAGWNVEMLIPWYIAPMRKAEGDSRTIGLYLDRVIGATGELSDMDIGGISSGSSIVSAIQTNGTLTGLHATQNSMSTLGAGSAAGHGAGSSMGGQISDSIQRGMAPLNNIGSMMGGK